jgi:signal peptidase I
MGRVSVTRTLVAAAGVVAVTGAFALEVARAGTGPATVRVTAKQIETAAVDAGRKGPSPGDQELMTSLVYNIRVTPKSIGQYELACTFVRGASRICRGIIHLPKGDIVVGGSVKHPALYELAVLGGTSLYDNARGAVTVTRLGTRPTRELLLVRLVGLPGETVREDGAGFIWVDGRRLAEPYVTASARAGDSYRGRTWHVPQGSYFMLGDNRSGSCDARAWGAVPRANLVGPVVLRYWPPDRIGTVG